jgi:hypothetical protein
MDAARLNERRPMGRLHQMSTMRSHHPLQPGRVLLDREALDLSLETEHLH